DGTVLAYGMRGNVWRSADAGATWSQVDVGSTAAINGGRQLDDGRVVLSGNGGLLLISRDDGRTFARAAGAAGDLAQVQWLGGDALLLVGAAGIQSFKTVQSSTAGTVP
ncbi:MAG: WD40/YVTN/BNR-like repeat-containing protein, partial [Panacagrimonas sp.]